MPDFVQCLLCKIFKAQLKLVKCVLHCKMVTLTIVWSAIFVCVTHEGQKVLNWNQSVVEKFLLLYINHHFW